MTPCVPRLPTKPAYSHLGRVPACLDNMNSGYVIAYSISNYKYGIASARTSRTISPRRKWPEDGQRNPRIIILLTDYHT